MIKYFANHWKSWLLFLVVLLLTVSGAVLTEAWPVSVTPLSTKQALQHLPQLEGIADRILRTFVDRQGRVNYSFLKKHAKDLDLFLGVVAKISPQTHPHLFPTKDARLAYWINAYNLAILKNVLRFPRWSDLHSFLRKVRFFALSHFTFGKKIWSLYNLEHQVIRARFLEPRIHFALNCASLGCPRLPQEAFRAAHLQQQLERETKFFLQEPRNVRLDQKSRVVYLSPLFAWYRDDFAQWLQEKKLPHGTQNAILLYINRYRQPKALLPTHQIQVVYNAYDWRQNRIN